MQCARATASLGVGVQLIGRCRCPCPSVILPAQAVTLNKPGRQCRRVLSRRLRAVGGDEMDPIERAVGFIFGRQALADKEPMGLKRMTFDSHPEQFPATLTEVAGAVDDDSPEVALFRPMLARTQLQALSLEIAFDADVDGWDAGAFHRRVDGRGAAVVLASTLGGSIVGGYNPRGFIGLGEDRNSPAAFLFTCTSASAGQPWIKLPKVGGAALAVIDSDTTGPCFGPDGLTIKLGPSNPKACRSKLGSYYAKRPDGAKNLFEGEEARSGKAELAWLRVYVGKGRSEKFELDGIVWRSSAEVSEPP